MLKKLRFVAQFCLLVTGNHVTKNKSERCIKGGIRRIVFVICIADVGLYRANTNSVKKTHSGIVRRCGGGAYERKHG